MRDGVFLDFPRSEYRQRVSKTRKIMERESIDGLILTMRENIEYISGFQTILFYYPFKQFCLILNMDDDPYLVVDQLHTTTAANTSWTNNVRVWGTDGVSHLDAISKAVGEAGLTNKRVGMELGASTRLNMTQFDYELFRKKLPWMKLVDGAAIPREARMVKSEEELSRVRMASQILAKAWKTGFESLRAGMTEKEFLRSIEIEMLRLGADSGYNKAEGILHVSTGKEKMRQYGSVPVDRRIEKGDFVRIDGGATFKRYSCDMTRSFYFGQKPSPEDRHLMDALIRAHARIPEVVRPGITSGQIVDEVLKIFREERVEKAVVKWNTAKTQFKYLIGHGIGLIMHEDPYIVQGGEFKWREKMVFACELLLKEFEEENTYEIGKSGAKLLTPLEHKSAFSEGEHWKLA
jgi:Xaa-Pro aminopeptidase